VPTASKNFPNTPQSVYDSGGKIHQEIWHLFDLMGNIGNQLRPSAAYPGIPGSDFHPELSWLHPAMAAAKFLVSSDDTPGVKHLFKPLVLHIGVTRLDSAE